MKKMLMMGSSFGSAEFVEYAKKRGVYTITTDYLPPEKSSAKLVADEYWMISTTDLDALEKKCKEVGVDGIFAGATELNLDMGMELAKRLGLPWYCTEEAWHYSRNKADFKRICKEVGVPVATDYYLSDALTEEELNSVKFPVVVKPVDQGGNDGLSYCYNREQLVEAYRYAQSVSDEKTIIVERMLHGQEYYVTYLAAEDEIRLLYITTEHAEPGTPKNLYTIITSVADNVRQYIEDLNPMLIRAFQKIGIKNGICWAELIRDEDGIFYLLEIGHRFGSDMIYQSMKNVNGFDTMNWVLEAVLGKKHTSFDMPEPQTKAFERCACSYEFFTNREDVISEITGLEEIAKEPGVMIDFIRYPGNLVRYHQPVGKINFDTDNCEKMCEMIKKINSKVHVNGRDGTSMITYFTDFKTLNTMYVEGIKEK